MKTNKVVKAIALAGIVLGSALAGGIAGANLFPKEVPYEVEKVITQFVEVPVEVPVEVEKLVEVEVEKIVEIDNGNLAMVLEHVYDNDGQVEYLIDDLEDDEVDQIVDRVIFINDIKAISEADINAEGLNLLHKEYVEDERLDKKEISRFRIKDDIVYSDIDFEDGDAIVTVEATFEQDKVKYAAVFEVEIRDGKVEESTLVSVELR